MNTKLNNTDGYTNLLEFVLITAILVMAAVYFFLGGNWMKYRMKTDMLP